MGRAGYPVNHCVCPVHAAGVVRRAPPVLHGGLRYCSMYIRAHVLGYRDVYDVA